MTRKQLHQKLAQRLIEARKMKQVSQLELAQAIKSNADTIVTIENGNPKHINFYTMYKICEFLDLDLDYFID